MNINEFPQQVNQVISIAETILQGQILGIYLYGSATVSYTHLKKSAGAIRHLELCGIALTLFALRLFGKILVGQYAVHGRVDHAFVADIRLTERTLIFQAAFYHDPVSYTHLDVYKRQRKG